MMHNRRVPLGIAGFVPVWLSGLETIMAAHGDRLARLPGRQLTSVDMVHLIEDDSWYADCPVIFDFEGERMEICHQKFDDLSIAWNTIDWTATVEGWEESDFTPVWRNGDDRVGSYIGAVVREAALLEWRAGHDLADGMVAVEFVFDPGRLAITSALDET
jgi:hypothetical protein